MSHKANITTRTAAVIWLGFYKKKKKKKAVSYSTSFLPKHHPPKGIFKLTLSTSVVDKCNKNTKVGKLFHIFYSFGGQFGV